MKVIYEPKGAAREYAPLALNLYTGCTHDCRYCYAPAILRKTQEEFSHATLRANLLERLEDDCAALREKGCTDEILLCFSCDPYMVDLDTTPTRMALKIIGHAGLNATVLTKGGTQACRDFDLLRRYGFRFGTSLSLLEGPARQYWEPNAADVNNRFIALHEAHRIGIQTWVSLEPVITPSDALAIILEIHGDVDKWAVGKINHNRAIEDQTNWTQFREQVTRLLDRLNATYYIKSSLRPAKLAECTNMDGSLLE